MLNPALRPAICRRVFPIQGAVTTVEKNADFAVDIVGLEYDAFGTFRDHIEHIRIRYSSICDALSKI